MRYLMLFALVLAPAITQAKGENLSLIKLFMQSYIDSVSKNDMESIKSDDAFKGQIENDQIILKPCQGKKCVLTVLPKTRVYKKDEKTTYFAFISIKDLKSKTTIKPDGCYVVYTNDKKELTLSAYDHHCDEN